MVRLRKDIKFTRKEAFPQPDDREQDILVDEAVELVGDDTSKNYLSHSALKNCSPLMYRENHAPPAGEFLARFFRSGTARVAPLRALATLGPPCLRFKIAPKMT